MRNNINKAKYIGVSIFLSVFLLLVVTCNVLGKKEITRAELNENLSSFKEKYISLITVDEGCTVYDFAISIGESFQYAIYDIRSIEKSYSRYDNAYLEIVVLDDEKVVTIIRQEYTISISPEGLNNVSRDDISSANDILLEVDVNFDGKNDIVLNTGSPGASYSCYVQKDDTFVYDTSFSKEQFDMIEKNKIILTSETEKEIEKRLVKEMKEKIEKEKEFKLSLLEEKYLPLITIDENCEIYDFAMTIGEDFQYVVYGIRSAEYNAKTIYWEVIVLDDERVVTIIRQDRNGGAIATAEGLVLEADANFDGTNDILLFLGHFGPRGNRIFSCYIRKDDTFVYVPSFSNIPNPEIGAGGVFGSWRDWEDHFTVYFRFIDGKFVEESRTSYKIE